MPKGYKNSLYYRIKFLGGNGILKNAQDLQDIREKRNEVAHESSKYIRWQDLDDYVAKIEHELQNLGLVGSRPKYEFFAERSKMRESAKPGFSLAQDYCYGLKINGRKVVEISWAEHIE